MRASGSNHRAPEPCPGGLVGWLAGWRTDLGSRWVAATPRSPGASKDGGRLQGTDWLLARGRVRAPRPPASSLPRSRARAQPPGLLSTSIGAASDRRQANAHPGLGFGLGLAGAKVKLSHARNTLCFATRWKQRR